MKPEANSAIHQRAPGSTNHVTDTLAPCTHTGKTVGQGSMTSTLHICGYGFLNSPRYRFTLPSAISVAVYICLKGGLGIPIKVCIESPGKKHHHQQPELLGKYMSIQRGNKEFILSSLFENIPLNLGN